MNRTLASAAALLAAGGVVFANTAYAADPAATGAATAKTAGKIQRGQYLVTTSGCNDCHTPLKMGKNGPEPDLTRLLSGHPEALKMPPAPKLPDGPWLVTVSATNTAWAGPWGVSFTANLTPDNETGMGTWTLRAFIDTMRIGRHLGAGRPVLPPMPIPAYKHFSDQDMDAIFSYLRTIPAIKNRVPEPMPPAAAK